MSFWQSQLVLPLALTALKMSTCMDQQANLKQVMEVTKPSQIHKNNGGIAGLSSDMSIDVLFCTSTLTAQADPRLQLSQSCNF